MYKGNVVPSEEKYRELFDAGCKLAMELIQVDGGGNPSPGFFAKRKLRKAKALFQSATFENPENAAPLLMLAKIEDSLGDKFRSLDWLQKAWLLEPDNLILLIELGGAYGLVGKHKEATTVLLEGKKLYPNEPRILFNLGISFLLQNQPKAAVEVFDKTVEIEPDFELNQKILKYSKEVANGNMPTPRNQSEIAKHI